MGPLGRGPTPVVTDCSIETSCLGRGFIDNDYHYSSIACCNTGIVMNSNINFCHNEKTSLEPADGLGKGEHGFRVFDKAHNNVVFDNTINSNSSLYSANLFSGPSGHHNDINIHMFTGQSNVNSLASPPILYYVKD